jgi:outer membrane receptor protein involved in Fe transport
MSRSRTRFSPLRILSGTALVSLTCLRCWAAAADSADTTDTSGLQEITVTAEKYNSTIQNTPISISALSGDQLIAAGITSVEDVAHEVPGLSMRSAGPGLTEYEARGLASNGGAAPTVGFYLDEVPLSPPALSQSGKVVIDPDLFDVDRIEVLRGPQGTLYGSGSMGGTVKVITNQPKLGAFEGAVQGTLSDTQGGSGNGGGSLMLNLPIGDTLALRVVATDTYRSGWLDRIVVSPFPAENGTTRGDVAAGPITGVATNVNTETLYSGRATLLWKPSDDLSVTGSAFVQRMVLGGYDDFDSPPGAGAAYVGHYEAFNVPEPIDDTIHIFSLNAVFKTAFADLTSATAYWYRDAHQTQDASESVAFANGAALVPLPYSEVDDSRQFSQEIRLNSNNSDTFHWVAGAFFSDLNSLWQEYGANELYTAPTNPTGIIYESNNPYTVTQSALFVDGSYEFTKQWKFEAGLRWYDYQSRQYEQEWGYDASVPAPIPRTQTTASDHGFNPRFDLSYSPTDELTTYISASKGFRPGGANQIVPPPNQAPFCAPGAGLNFGPDSVWDYEIGEKARLFDNWLSVNSDFYYIKWNDIQQTLLLTCGYEYEANAGNGRSFGPELEINAKLSENWLLALNGTYTDARLTQPNTGYLNFLTGVAARSNGLPYCPTADGCTAPILNVPRATASATLAYTTELFSDYKLTARATANYTGQTYDEAYYFAISLPAYTIANARLILAKDNWSANLFVDNLTNKVAAMTANNTSFQFNIPQLVRYTTNQPRTFGTQINYKF